MPTHVTRINVGCGASPTPGWINYDNSRTLHLAGHPVLLAIASRIGVVSDSQRYFAAVAVQTPISRADITRGIPAEDGSVDVVYSSHMLEHLERPAAAAFLLEVRRVLAPGGVVRLVVPDMALLVENYVSSGDCDALIEGTRLAKARPHTPQEKFRWLLVGDRGHAWMYDPASLTSLLMRSGFKDPRVAPVGTTSIPEPGALNLRERESESLYVEANKPS